MQLLWQWDDTTLVGTEQFDNVYNEIWGWHDATNGKEYAILGAVNGTYFFDLDSQQLVDFEAGTSDSVIHRDYKDKGKYLYAVTDEGGGSLQIFDMSYLPDSVHKVYDSSTFFHKSHNIWIEGDRMYACIPRYKENDPRDLTLAIYDIAVPETPTLIKEYPRSDVAWDYIHDLYTRGDTAWLNSSWSGLYVVDFSDPENPDVLAILDQYPQQGYNHSGWLSDDGQTYVFADENHGLAVKVCDVRDLGNINIVSYLSPSMVNPPADFQSIAHNQVFRGQYLFSSYYYNGLYAFDLTDPAQPVLAGFYDTYPENNVGEYHGNWGVYPLLPSGRILASDMQGGLLVLEFAPLVIPNGIGDDLNDLIQVGPNPSSDFIRIKLNGLKGDLSLSLYDLAGRKLGSENYRGPRQQLTWQLPQGIVSGMYLLRLESDGSSVTRKLQIY